VYVKGYRAEIKFMDKRINSERIEIRKIMIAGGFAVAAALIGLAGVLITGYWNRTKATGGRQEKIVGLLAIDTPTARVCHILVKDDSTGANLSNVHYAIAGITGTSDSNGKIELPVPRLHAATEQDMFQITLTREGYGSCEYYIGVTEEDITLKLKRHESL
jgi:hypothetical protein